MEVTDTSYTTTVANLLARAEIDSLGIGGLDEEVESQ